MILTHPNINPPKAPKAFERMCERGLEIDAFLKMEGMRVRRHGHSVAVSFESEIAAEKFEAVIRKALRA
ncbi:MAG: hypothetical protein C4583_15605 [Anaerolineaceae bacterium]|nr:MAG: hypothetical protein C4583_15605 [Anaerolineaceae bacterium]